MTVQLHSRHSSASTIYSLSTTFSYLPVNAGVSQPQTGTVSRSQESENRGRNRGKQCLYRSTTGRTSCTQTEPSINSFKEPNTFHIYINRALAGPFAQEQRLSFTQFALFASTRYSGFQQNASVLITKPRNEEEEYDRLVCGYYR